VHQSGNPAFRRLPSGVIDGGPYAGFGGTQTGVPHYPGATEAIERPMTVDDVVTKTAASVGVAILTGIFAAVWAHGQLAAGAQLSVFIVTALAAVAGFVLAIAISFTVKASAGLTLGYSAVEGVFLGAMTGTLEALLPPAASGVGLQAVMGTAVVFVVMLFVYRSGAVKVTPRMRKWVTGALLGAMGLVLVDLLLGLFDAELGVRGTGTLGVLVGLAFVALGAFLLLLDFDMADNMIRAGMPAKYAWYAAFGLMTALVWLYFEIVRLLAIFNSE